MLTSSLQINATTTTITHLPLTMKSHPPSKPHNQMSQSPDCLMTANPIDSYGTAIFLLPPSLSTENCLPTMTHLTSQAAKKSTPTFNLHYPKSFSNAIVFLRSVLGTTESSSLSSPLGQPLDMLYPILAYYVWSQLQNNKL
jgi:hypothetical protein